MPAIEKGTASVVRPPLAVRAVRLSGDRQKAAGSETTATGHDDWTALLARISKGTTGLRYADNAPVTWELRPTGLDDLELASALAAVVQDWSASSRIPAEVYSSGLDRVGIHGDNSGHTSAAAPRAVRGPQRRHVTRQASLISVPRPHG